MSAPTVTDSDIDQHVRWFAEAFRDELLVHVPGGPELAEFVKVPEHDGSVLIQATLTNPGIKQWGCYLRLRGSELEDYGVEMQRRIVISARDFAKVAANEMFYVSGSLL